MDWLPVASGFQSRDEVPGRNDGDAFVLMKVEQVTDVAGHEVVRSATNGCRERFVVVRDRCTPGGAAGAERVQPCASRHRIAPESQGGARFAPACHSTLAMGMWQPRYFRLTGTQGDPALE